MSTVVRAMGLLGVVTVLSCDSPPPVSEGSSTGPGTSDASTGGGSTGPGGDSTTDGSADSSGSSSGAEESSGTGPAGGECLQQLTLDETFVLVEGETGQIHANVHFDPVLQDLWVTYNRPAEGSSNFEVAFARVGCDGGLARPPIALSTSAQNHIDPELAFSDSRAVVVWAGDDGSGGSGNLDVITRVLDLDGVPVTPDEQPLSLTRGGAPFTASAWMAHVAAAPDGTFVVAGTRAVEEVSAFQAFVQRLDADGVASEPTIEPLLDMGAAHTEPRISIDDDGTTHVVWSRTEDFSTYEVVTFSLPDGDDGSAVSVEPLDGEGDHSAVVAGAGSVWGKSADEPSGRGIRLFPEVGGAALSLSESGRIDYGPGLALGSSGAAVAWYRLLSGIRNELVVARVDGVGTDRLAAGPEQVLPDVEAAPYGVALTHVEADVYLAAWSQGDSPNFVVYGRFVDLGL